MEFVNECITAFDSYALRSFGIGERGLPGSTNTKGGSPINLCNITVLIGSGMLRNILFGAIALSTGFFLALSLALLKARDEWFLNLPARAFIYTFRGTPLLIQFFIGYLIFASLGAGVFRTAAYGASVVLFFNTACYSAEILYGAYRAVPNNDLEAARAFALSPFDRFRDVTFPTMMRLAWPAYTNEAIFLFHATTIVFLVAGFPVRRQSGDALYYAQYFAERTFDPFIAYPIVALYFVAVTAVLLLMMRMVQVSLNRHLRNER